MKSLIASQTSGLHQRFRFTALWEGQRVEVSEAAYYSLEKDASDTIAKAFKYLLPDHEFILKDLRRENGELGNTLDLSSHAFRGNLRERLNRASSDRSLLDRERVETIRSIAEVIPEKLQRAQEKFIDTIRRRERSFGR
ncbi:hypothetical protein C6558_35345 [Ensifer sp. NM-2]|uniref:hypothetical protein n=1 Tax=Ensifer sp. NM-2 TaxID=2109730 RepID=UPI000D11ECF9|nr:hypothetical protein [Ensifer sp. NM-2]PSS59971.1 hypothetical protein C6558_35345 [Ensifer sp. NM-2]